MSALKRDNDETFFPHKGFQLLKTNVDLEISSHNWSIIFSVFLLNICPYFLRLNETKLENEYCIHLGTQLDDFADHCR